jgi:hypothetical protein
MPPMYNTFNLLLRRRGEANNFKAVLQTIRDGNGSSRFHSRGVLGITTLQY